LQTAYTKIIKLLNLLYFIHDDYRVNVNTCQAGGDKILA